MISVKCVASSVSGFLKGKSAIALARLQGKKRNAVDGPTAIQDATGLIGTPRRDFRGVPVIPRSVCLAGSLDVDFTQR